MFIFRCNNTKQFEGYQNINDKLFKANETEIYDLTGCLSNCNKYIYDAQPMGETDVEIYDQGQYDKLTPNTVNLRFIFTNGHHEVKEEGKLYLLSKV